MDRCEAIQVLETISDFYPKFEVTKKKAQLLIPQLNQMSHKLVMEKLFAHVAVCPYPPTIAEIAAYPVKSNDHLEEIKRWRVEASKVPDDVKQAFHQQMLKLEKGKVNDSHC
jgi:hypothetical protein